MRKRTSLVLIFMALPCWAGTPITSEKHPSCNEKAPCLIKQPKAQANYRVIFQTAKDQDVMLIKQVSISDEKTKATDSFEMKGMSGIFPGETYQFESLDLNNDGYTDLALMAFSSARQGPIYYYFIYDPTKKKFIMSPEPYPELKLDPKTKTYEAQEGRFKLDSTYTLRPLK